MMEIQGTVNAALEAVVRIAIRKPDGALQEFDAAIDTGFNGFLTLPPTAIADLELPWIGRHRCELADGSMHAFSVHEAIVAWLGRERLIEVEAADAQPLVGMLLMRGHTLKIDVDPGGGVTLHRRHLERTSEGTGKKRKPRK